jgi:hypothetical protein
MMQHIMCIWEGSHKDPEYGFVLSDEELYVLLVSSMFHDFSHSGGLLPDKVNVDNAISGMNRCLDEMLYESKEVETLKEKCEEVIRATEYPYVIADDDLKLCQRILRECDILVAFYDDVFLQNVCGLTEEMRVTDKKKFIGDWMNFILESSKKFRLKYSLDIIEKYSTELVEEMKVFVSILNK